VATNLVEVTMYGITTLYEKFEPPADKDKKVDSDTEPAKTDPPKADPKAPTMPPTGTPSTTPMPKDMPPVPMKDMPPAAPTDPAKK
jgi:hypothetical protein